MKILKKILSWLASPFTLGLIVTGAMLYVSFLYYDRYQDSAYNGESAFFDFMREIHQKTIDFRLVDRGPLPGHPDVAILGIDEPALEQEGRWPWPREKIGRVVERAIQEYNAKVIAFDIIFSEEDANSSIPTLARLRRTLASKQALNPELHDVFKNEMEKADSDRKFGEIIKKYGDHLVMGAYFEEYEKASLEQVSQQFDECIDHLHERANAYTYWQRDQRPPLVRDDHAKSQQFPEPLKAHLMQYFGFLESGAIDGWLTEQPDRAKRISAKLVALGFPPDAPLPPFLQPYIANAPQQLKEILEAMTGQAPDDETVAEIFSAFSDEIPRKDQAILQERMRNVTKEYCHRFLREGDPVAGRNDELLNEATFRAMYTGDADYSAFSLATKWDEANKAGMELPTGSLKSFVDMLRASPRLNQVTSIDRWWVNIPVLAENTKYTGFFNAHLDSDGTIRRNMFLARRGNYYAKSLALTSFLIANNYSVSATILPITTDPIRKGVPLEYMHTPDAPTANGATAEVRAPATSAKRSPLAGFRILDSNAKDVMTVPVDAAGRMAINYSGPKHMFPHISAADILSDRPTAVVKFRHFDPQTGRIEPIMEVNKKEFLKDKLLFFGATATGIFDLRVTPFEENFPGVETHANMLSNLLVEHDRATGKGERVKGMPGFLRTYPELEAQIMLVVLLVLGVSFSGLLAYLGSIAGLLVTGLSLGSVYAIDKFILFKSGVVITVMLPVLLVSMIFVILTFYKYFTEERKKRELKGTFEKYVSPAIVAEVLSDPENIELGGKKMELTVMFSDVRGFTTISEKLDPRALSDLLNSYLTPMTNLVFAHKGTLDKYMGDAVMAFWGAPIHFKDHAKHACRCALQMIVKLKELQEVYRAQGLPEIDIGIGLNTGEMSVGNMGSDTVRSYTVMGDAVNLGSRLEGINKQYGTRIIVSEFTQAAIQDEFICREVDWVRVKGKAQPVRIFELVAEKSVPPETRTLLDHFSNGFAAYHAKDWPKAISQFTAALNLKPDDEPSTLYLERCQEYQQNPPPDDWDGVFTMTTK